LEPTEEKLYPFERVRLSDDAGVRELLERGDISEHSRFRFLIDCPAEDMFEELVEEFSREFDEKNFRGCGGESCGWSSFGETNVLVGEVIPVPISSISTHMSAKKSNASREEVVDAAESFRRNSRRLLNDSTLRSRGCFFSSPFISLKSNVVEG
jgi:hypothetical protein